MDFGLNEDTWKFIVGFLIVAGLVVFGLGALVGWLLA